MSRDWKLTIDGFSEYTNLTVVSKDRAVGVTFLKSLKAVLSCCEAAFGRLKMEGLIFFGVPIE